MNASRFDRIAALFAERRLSRRAALRAGGLAAGAAALAAPGVGAAQEATPGAAGTPTAGPAGMADNNATLFVQTAAGGTFVPNPNAATPMAATPAAGAGHGQYLLTLTGHAGETIAFSDRPQRNFGEVKTTKFFKSMGFTAANPPNAALVADSPQQEDDVLLIELLNPTYDAGTKTLTYEANILSGYQGEMLKPLASKQQDQQIASKFDSASLFIDDCPDANPLRCYTACLNSVGNLGKRGMCWHWSAFECEPCSGGWDGTASECNATFSACNGKCFTDWGDSCSGP